jgi:hypothetical protein
MHDIDAGNAVLAQQLPDCHRGICLGDRPSDGCAAGCSDLSLGLGDEVVGSIEPPSWLRQRTDGRGPGQ